LQAATTAPMAGLISVWLIHRGRKPLGPGTQGQQMYTLEQLLPRGWDLVGWAGVLGVIYIFTGIGLSTQCLPLFSGGPAAILLCYLVLFLLLVLHLSRAPDRCDKAYDKGSDETPAVNIPSNCISTDETSASINTPLLEDSTAITTNDGRSAMATGAGGAGENDAGGEDASPSFPEIEWRWQRGVCIAAGLSASITVLTKLVPALGAVGSTLVILGIDWSGVIVGLLYFVTKAIAGGVWLLLKPPLQPVFETPTRGRGSLVVPNIVVALFSAILVPALLANGAVEMLPELRAPAISAAVLVGSVLLSIVIVIVGLCCTCRGWVQ
jgi:hypothetical protein